MKRIPVMITVLMVSLVLGTGLALAQQYAICPPADIGSPVEKLLSSSFCNYQTYQIDKKAVHLNKAEKQLKDVLKKDPGNPIALNNLAAIMVEKQKLDKADTLLKKALDSVKAKPCLVRLNRVCDVNNICVAVEPVKIGEGNQDLAPLIKLNSEMVKAMMARLKRPAAQ